MRSILLTVIAFSLSGCASMPKDSPFWPYTSTASPDKLPEHDQNRDAWGYEIKPGKIPSVYETTAQLASQVDTVETRSGLPIEIVGSKEIRKSETVPTPTVKRRSRLSPVSIITQAPAATTKQKGKGSIEVDLLKDRQ